MYPRRRGTRTLLIALYALCASFDGGMPPTGRGKETTRVRVAVAGMELSSDLVVSTLVNFSTKGHRISAGALAARGPMLHRYASQQQTLAKKDKPTS